MGMRTAEMTADEEQEIALKILALEDDLRPMLQATPACAALLARQDEHAGRTRHAAVERLEDAVGVAQGTGMEPWLLAEIVTTWNEAQNLRWRLALSAERVAKREARRYNSSRISLEDLEQEAVLGLLAAARRFEPGRGVRFAVYARWWVRAQITRAVQLAEAFRISSGAMELHRNVRKLVVADELIGVLRPLSELAGELGVEPQRLRDVMAAIARRVADEGDDGDGRSTVAQLPDTDAPTPEDVAVDADTWTRLRHVIGAAFTPREQHILARRYGLDTERASATSIASTLSLTAERVRQLEHQCVATLRAVFAREMDV